MTTCSCADVTCSIYGCRLYRFNPPRTAPAQYAYNYPVIPSGCVCPPTSEQTCMSEFCPRKSRKSSFQPKDSE